MAFYSYSNISGQLLEISDFPLASIDNTSTSENELSKTVLETSYSWDTDSLSFITKTFRILSKKNFLKKFTPTEYSNIKAATSSNGVIDYYWQLFMVADNVTLNDQDTILGIQVLEQLGLIGPGRSTEILA